MVIKKSALTLFYSLLLEDAEVDNGSVANSATPPNDKKGNSFFFFFKHSEIY